MRKKKSFVNRATKRRTDCLVCTHMATPPITSMRFSMCIYVNLSVFSCLIIYVYIMCIIIFLHLHRKRRRKRAVHFLNELASDISRSIWIPYLSFGHFQTPP